MKSILAIISLIFLIGCGGNTTDEPILKEIASIKINPPQTTRLYVTQNDINFSATATYNDNSTSDITQYVSWYLQDPKYYNNVSFVDGSIYAITNGDNGDETNVSTITASYPIFEATLNQNITVIPATSISIDDSNISDKNNIDTGITYKIYADVNFSDGNQTRIGKNNYRNVLWKVEGNATIISIENGTLEIQFSSGESNITVSIFDINSTKTYNAN